MECPGQRWHNHFTDEETETQRHLVGHCLLDSSSQASLVFYSPKPSGKPKTSASSPPLIQQFSSSWSGSQRWFQGIHKLTKVHISQSYSFSSSHVWMWELDHKKCWALKDWCFWTVVLEKTPEGPLVSKEIKPVNPKGNQPCIFTGRTNAEAEAPILWPHNAKSQLTGKAPDVGKDWRQEKGMTEDEMVGWHYQLNGHECEQTLGDSEGQGMVVCCSSWGHRELDC